MSLANTVAKNLLAARVRRNLTQQALAAKVGLSVSYVSMLERGQRTPPLETLGGLAKALGVTPLDLLRERATGRRRSSRR